jgi:hypothetical protein
LQEAMQDANVRPNPTADKTPNNFVTFTALFKNAETQI